MDTTVARVIGMFYGFIGLMTVLSGGMLLHSGTS